MPTPNSKRPSYRPLFVDGERQLEVYFYTSNTEKFLQARAVFGMFGVMIRHFRSRMDPYSEDYRLGKEGLLARSLREVVGAVGSRNLVFVEDTSLRIDAFSQGDDDFPGLAVKEWFPTVTFEQVDAELKSRGTNRSATVKSDIALHVPGLLRPIFFSGRTHGVIANSPPEFQLNLAYPWLTPDTFNGWLIPNGAQKRLGEMSFEESWEHDFRTQAFFQMVDRLEEYTAILNLPPISYTRQKDSRMTPVQITWDFAEKRPPVFVVVGRTCAGKTVFGQHSEALGLRFIEASSVLRMLMAEMADGTSTLSAKQFLDRYGSDCVARAILTRFMTTVQSEGVVITGFRTIEELRVIKDVHPEAKIVLVDASERTRFERYTQRRRDTAIRTLSEFRNHDVEQWSFGLLRVAEDFADIKIVNESTFGAFLKQVTSVVKNEDLGNVPGISLDLKPKHDLDRNQLYRCLHCLSLASGPVSCEDVQLWTTQTGSTILHNNVNKVLKRVPELARRIEHPGHVVHYEILSGGRAYVRFMAARSGATPPSSGR